MATFKTPVLDSLEGSDYGHEKGGRSLSLDSEESSVICDVPPRRSKSDTNCSTAAALSKSTIDAEKHYHSCLDDSPVHPDWSSRPELHPDSRWCERAINAPCFTPTSIWTPTVADSASTDEYQPRYYGEVDAHPHLHRRRPSNPPPTLSEGGGGYMYYSAVRTPAQSSLPSPLNCTTPSGAASTSGAAASRNKTPLYISDHLPDVVASPGEARQDDSHEISRFRGQLYQLGVRDSQEQLVTARLLISTARGIDELSRRLGKPVVGELVQLLLAERAAGEGSSSNIESTPSTADEELLPVGLLEIE
ncbi:hypothetical protein FOZ61_009842 [Perkinsus olseni]|uniref:Uncharacterized protein n=1 Tax=Perkinsus olseni TaxID=32597 RepID=A0A7J6M459_PEROL|nr:hypothetical protein FOZ61_009842 [Perkinsus olseni]